MSGRASIPKVTLLVLLSCSLTPCSAFLLESITSHVTQVAGTIIWEVVKLIIEGPTGLVLRALSYDYFGIRDALWHLGWWGLDKGIEKVGTVASATLWWSTTKTLDKFYDAFKWVFNTAVGGVTNAVNFAKGSVGISTALEKLEKLKEETILKKTDATTSMTSTAKPDGMNVSIVIGRHIGDSKKEASTIQLQDLVNSLEEAFMAASHFDQHSCLPLVLCDIYADKPSTVNVEERRLSKLFKNLLDIQPPPPWAHQYLEGIQLGIDSKEKKDSRICRKAFPICPYPVTVLRSFLSFVFNNNGLNTFISENQAYFVH